MSYPQKKRVISPLTHALCIIAFGAMLFFSSIMQCSGLKLFGITPDLTFALVCAIGFVAGERYGGAFGLLGGALIMSLGSGGISFAPVMMTLCGYLCGAMPDLILRRNFLSYLVYTAIMGGIHIFFTMIYFLLLSESFEIWNVIGRRILPELFSCIILMIAAYGVIFLLYKLFKGKRNNK